MSEAGPVYDPVELRRRIAVCFSAGELKELADSLGVGSISWERGLDEAAREIVRQSERYAGLPALVARLREVRPLVEWPEPAAPVAPPPILVDPAPAMGPPPPNPRPIPPTFAFPAPPPLAASPGAFGPPEAAAPAAPVLGDARERPPATLGDARERPQATLFDPYAPPPGPTVIQVPVPARAPFPGSAPPQRAAWPGVIGEPPPRSGGVDPRIFLAVAGLMVVAAVIAYLAGRASSTPAEADTSPAASASAPVRAARSDGPAAFVADRLARSFADMARICELPPSAGTSVYVFKRVFDRCGPVAPQRHASPSPIATSTAEPTAQPATPADPAPPRNKRPGRGGDPGSGEAVPAAKGCMGTCDATHGACRAHCGPEPTESGAYDGYQRCLGGCLRDASRCRLSCR